MMTKNAAIKLAKEALIKYATERYGWDAKYHQDMRDKYDRYIEAAKMLDELKDGGD